MKKFLIQWDETYNFTNISDMVTYVSEGYFNSFVSMPFFSDNNGYTDEYINLINNMSVNQILKFDNNHHLVTRIF